MEAAHNEGVGVVDDGEGVVAIRVGEIAGVMEVVNHYMKVQTVMNVAPGKWAVAGFVGGPCT